MSLIETQSCDKNLKDANRLFDQQQYKSSFKLFKQLAENDCISAQDMVGYMYLEGYGIKKNILKAIEWWDTASIQGSLYAQFQLGCLYIREGKVQEGLKLLNIAAEHSYPEALYLLAGYFYHGTYLNKDVAKAIRFYEEAMLQGHQDAAKDLMTALRIRDGYIKTFLNSLVLVSKYIVKKVLK